ncbi:ABC transporter substrate-binding protein [Rhodococcus fascians]|nr:ABC transporter substrate-binding protein [Rhodococcus fascians]
MSYRLSVTAASIAAVFVLGGCGSGTAGTNAADATSARIAVPSSISTLDPLTAASQADTRAVALVAGTLYAFDFGAKVLTPVPSLASGASTSQDGLTVTVTLKDGLTFSDSSPLTVDDVVATFERGLASPLAGDEVFGSIAGVQAVGQDVVFTLRQPRADFLSQISTSKAAILPRRASTDEAFFDDPVFAGPFSVEGDFRGREVKLVRNPNFGGAAPALDEVNLVTVADPYAALSQLQSGSIDLVTPVPADRFVSLPDSVVTQTVATAATEVLTFNNDVAPLNDPRVRQAIGVAVDREALTAIGFHGIAEPASTPVPFVGDRMKPVLEPKADLDRARELLVGTACENGCTFDVNTASSDSISGQIATAIQQMLSPVGITANPVAVDDTTLVERNFNGEFTSMVTPFGGGTLAAYLSATLNPAGGLQAAFSYWDRPDANALIGQVIALPDEEQGPALEQLRAAYVQDFPWIPLASAPSLVAVKKGLESKITVGVSDMIEVAPR